MAVITDKFVMSHVPKTGGTWVQSVLELLVPYLSISTFSIDRGHHQAPVTPESLGNRLVIYGVRHPASWLRAYYGHQIRSGCQADFAPMPHARTLLKLVRESGSFRRFVDLVLAEGTIVSDIWRAYATAYGDHPTYQLRRESLGDSLVKALIRAGAYDWRVANQIDDILSITEPRRSGDHGLPNINLGLCEIVARTDEEAFRIGGYR